MLLRWIETCEKYEDVFVGGGQGIGEKGQTEIHEYEIVPNDE